jgi:hypothetical protein
VQAFAWRDQKSFAIYMSKQVWRKRFLLDPSASLPSLVEMTSFLDIFKGRYNSVLSDAFPTIGARIRIFLIFFRYNCLPGLQLSGSSIQ